MEIIKTKRVLDEYLAGYREQGKVIGLVPTMGALHEGHLSLLRHLRAKVDVLVCSIFVNPTQFNDPNDLEKYPRPIERDMFLLEESSCDVLFFPDIGEMYAADEPDWYLELGHLDKVLEAEHRPGHFQGVTQIVNKLFVAVRPDVACFGQKDFQQCMVIQYMVNKLEIPVVLEICPTVREVNGLAMSSRNARLSSVGRQRATVLYNTLKEVSKQIFVSPIEEVKRKAIKTLEESEGITLEYFAICREYDLTEVKQVDDEEVPLVALVAAWVDGVRLIDNMRLSKIA